MRRAVNMLAIPGGLVLVWLALAVYAGWVAAPAHAEVSAIPPIPHTLDGRGQCLACHGQTGVRAVPADHQGRAEAGCVACHQVAVPQPAVAQPGSSPAAKPAAPASDASCMGCHQAPATLVLRGGETLQAKVDPNELSASVHGKNVSCVACHKDKAAGYPHAKVEAYDLRAYTVAASTLCLDCHKNAGTMFQDSVHGQALAIGNGAAATCADCHGVHNVTVTERLARRPQVCAACHGVVTETYKTSVHGQLLTSGRADAASCLSCHSKQGSAHTLASIGDPDGPTAARNVPETCGQCHAQALKTYNETFHGRAMRLGVAGKAPNCVDCHGAYGVQRVHASSAPLDEARLAGTCGKCHEGADVSFASGWMGHEEASPGWFPAVFFTERFLFFLTTSVVAFGILHVEFDLLRWLVRRRKGEEKEEK